MYTFLGKQTPQNRKAIPFRQRRERFTCVCEQSAARRPHFASKSLYQKKRLRQKPQSVFYCISLFPLCGTPPPRTLLCRSPGSGINALVCLPDLQWHFRQHSSITVAGPRRILTCFPLSRPAKDGTYNHFHLSGTNILPFFSKCIVLLQILFHYILIFL